jgi:hypothetical protein
LLTIIQYLYPERNERKYFFSSKKPEQHSQETPGRTNPAG